MFSVLTTWPNGVHVRHKAVSVCFDITTQITSEICETAVCRGEERPSIYMNIWSHPCQVCQLARAALVARAFHKTLHQIREDSAQCLSALQGCLSFAEVRQPSKQYMKYFNVGKFEVANERGWVNNLF